MSSEETVSIQPIDKTTVNKICSGQVVLTIATAVKELLENSIDAGATSIQIKLEEYGSDLIEVIDNGCGVEEVNFQALTLKHHTSKITEFSDLYSVETFGFRGEALSSLCSLSDVTIITQHKKAVIGATLNFDHNGIITSNVKTLRKVGTTVRLKNLFSPLPIRRTEFMKNLKREYSKMCNVLYAYGLQSVGVRITCTNHVSKTKRPINTTIMDTKGESLESNIVSIFGVKQKQNLLKITEVTPSEETLSEFSLEKKNLNLQKFKLEGYISSCSHGSGRTSADRQFYYINSRPVDNSKVSKLVNDIYHQYNNHQYPFVVLNVKLESGTFDMNVTPDKRQILLQHEKLLLAVLKQSLHALFQTIPSQLEVQNVGLIKNYLNSSEKVDLSERLEKLKSNLKNLSPKNDRKEEAKSRIDSLLKLRSQFRNTAKDIKSQDCASKPRTTESKPNSDENEIILLIPSQANLENSSKIENNPESKVNSMTARTTKLENSIKPADVTRFSNGIERNGESNGTENPKVDTSDSAEGMEVTCDDKSTNFKVEVLERNSLKSQINSVVHENVEELEENEPKRMKMDEGLTEEVKNNRKCITYDVSLEDIKRMTLEYKKAERSQSVNSKMEEVKFLAEIKPQNNERAENELKREIKKESFKEMEIIGQFNLGFIITKLNSDIFIIDQHASDEKYNFETLQQTTVMQSQKLVIPQKLELTADKEEVMVQYEDIFKKNGFEFVFDRDAPPTKRISLTSIPLSKSTVFGKDDVDELLFLLENTSEIKKLRPSRMDLMFASRACRKSVMIGTPLNHREMRKIVNHMGEIEHPWNCPHGRPTMRHLVSLQMIRLNE